MIYDQREKSPKSKKSMLVCERAMIHRQLAKHETGPCFAIHLQAINVSSIFAQGNFTHKPQALSFLGERSRTLNTDSPKSSGIEGAKPPGGLKETFGPGGTERGRGRGRGGGRKNLGILFFVRPGRKEK
jgi:hypothetical protein